MASLFLSRLVKPPDLRCELRKPQGNIATSEALGLETNAGAVALTGSKPDGAPIIQKVGLVRQ